MKTPMELTMKLMRLGLCLWLALWALPSAAQTVLFQEDFAGGLGRFTATGGVTTSANGAVMRGSFGAANDGAITSASISTTGFTSITLAFDRVSSGLDLGEAGIAAVSVNGGAFTTLESTRTTTRARVTLQLPATASNQAS